MITLDYTKVNEYYKFYKTTNWSRLQMEKGLCENVLCLQFKDNIIVNENLVPVTIQIWDFLDYYNVEININLIQHLENDFPTLHRAVKYINEVFKKPFCKRCGKMTKIHKKQQLCADCLNSNCLESKTDKVCVICLDTISRNVFRTQCSHYFHSQCILGIKKCPQCRFNFYQEFEI